VAPCPACTSSSDRIHSYYERRLADLPWNGIPVEIRLRTRRFFCDTDACAQRIFTERLPETTATYARRTLRMEQALRWLGLALGGEAGARTAQRLGLVVSGDTLLRHLRRMSVAQKPVPVSPRVLGIDDWAWRKDSATAPFFAIWSGTAWWIFSRSPGQHGCRVVARPRPTGGDQS